MLQRVEDGYHILSMPAEDMPADANPALLNSLGKMDLAIVVDPIDGTANFAAGMPLFAAKGETIAGILYDLLLASREGRRRLLRSQGQPR